MTNNMKINNTNNSMDNIVTQMKENTSSWGDYIGLTSILFQEAISKGGDNSDDQRYSEIY